MFFVKVALNPNIFMLKSVYNRSFNKKTCQQFGQYPRMPALEVAFSCSS